MLIFNQFLIRIPEQFLLDHELSEVKLFSTEFLEIVISRIPEQFIFSFESRIQQAETLALDHRILVREFGEIAISKIQI